MGEGTPHAVSAITAQNLPGGPVGFSLLPKTALLEQTLWPCINGLETTQRRLSRGLSMEPEARSAGGTSGGSGVGDER